MAITVNVNAIVIVNGKATGEIRITRLVRQVCLIAPLQFILLLEPVNWILKKAISGGSTRGVYFDEIDVHLAQQFYSKTMYIMMSVMG
jgi:hypothetical protein